VTLICENSILRTVSVFATSRLEQKYINCDNDNLRYWLWALFNVNWI